MSGPDASDGWEESSPESSSVSVSSLLDPVLVFDISSLPPVNCHRFGHCVDLPGSFRCECDEGYEGDGIQSCESKESIDNSSPRVKLTMYHAGTP